MNEESRGRVIGVVLVFLALISLGWYASEQSKTTQKSDQVAEKTEKESDKKADKNTKKEKSEAKQPAEKKPSTGSADTKLEDSKDTITYTVGEGENYTMLARQAVSAMSYKLTDAERIAAETKLTQDAGAPLLQVGEKVKLDKSKVNAAIKWAKNLSAEDKAAWQTYVPYVIF